MHFRKKTFQVKTTQGQLHRLLRLSNLMNNSIKQLTILLFLLQHSQFVKPKAVLYCSSMCQINFMSNWYNPPLMYVDLYCQL